jgi:hypothetical protein
MTAFHSDGAAKRSFLAALEALEAGRSEAGDSEADLRLLSLPQEMGIPRELLALAEAAAEGLGAYEGLTWPRRFLEAVPPGAELGMVWKQWMLWSLRDRDWGLLGMDLESLVQPCLVMLERYYLNRVLGREASAGDILRAESVLRLMEEDAAMWRGAGKGHSRELSACAAARHFWDARDGSPVGLMQASRAAYACRRDSPNFALRRCERLQDLVSHAPAGQAAFVACGRGGS